MYKLSKRSYDRLNGIDAILVAILTEAIKESPYDFGIPLDGGLRTAERQKELYDIGRRGIEGEAVITYCDGVHKKSYHQSGKAFDVFGYKDGKASWDKDVLTEIATHIMNIAEHQFGVELTWGGSWSNPDMPHFQY
jgi:peptidoglycan L-alanyl-D-glutamate endopeptidase CwlK